MAAEPDALAGGHAYGRWLEDRELWDLVKFSREGARSTTDVIDADGVFLPDAERGRVLCEEGTGRSPSCTSCHGADGFEMPHYTPGHEEESGMTEAEEDEETIGSGAREDPWMFHHKARFGHPGSPMHGYAATHPASRLSLIRCRSGLGSAGPLPPCRAQVTVRVTG